MHISTHLRRFWASYGNLLICSWAWSSFPVSLWTRGQFTIVAECGQFFTMGSMRKFFICCLIQLKFRLRVDLKRWNDWGEFELDRTNSKNNISENSFALGHETDNRENNMVTRVSLKMHAYHDICVSGYLIVHACTLTPI